MLTAKPQPSPSHGATKYQHSLQWRLIVTLTSVVLLFISCVAGFSAWQGYKQAQKLQDMKLASLVSLAKSHDLTFERNQVNVNADYDLPTQVINTADQTLINVDILNIDNAENQTLIFWLSDKRLAKYFDANTLARLSHKADGLYDIVGNTGQWRVYLFTADPKNTDNNQLTTRLLVAENSNIRHTLAWQSAKQMTLPLLLLIPLLVLVLVLTINQLFLPLRTVTEILQHSSVSPTRFATAQPQDLSLLISDELVQDLPSEIQPFLRLIQQQIKDLTTTMAMNQRFVANASHQLRTPMTAVLLQAEQLKYLTVGTTDYQTRVDELLESIKRNNHLMNQLLLLAKTEQFQSPATISSYSTTQVISQLLIDYYPIAEKKHISLGVDDLLDVQLPINELGFKLIVQNLLENAIKYTPNDGKVDISLTQTNLLNVNSQIQHPAIALTVQDTGQGIDETELSKVLEPFYQAHANLPSQQSADPSNPSGFGLGLSIVSNLVNHSGGSFRLSNRYDSQRHTIQGLNAYVSWDITQEAPRLEQK